MSRVYLDACSIIYLVEGAQRATRERRGIRKSHEESREVPCRIALPHPVRSRSPGPYVTRCPFPAPGDTRRASRLVSGYADALH